MRNGSQFRRTRRGPFIAYNQDGTTSLQILESSQIDMSNPDAKEQFESGTHFNPVDLVCAVRDNKGEKYDLPKYVDKNTGFISLKSKNGRELKALELPGLWNGAMSDWSTVLWRFPQRRSILSRQLTIYSVRSISKVRESAWNRGRYAVVYRLFCNFALARISIAVVWTQ